MRKFAYPHLSPNRLPQSRVSSLLKSGLLSLHAETDASDSDYGSSVLLDVSGWLFDGANP